MTIEISDDADEDLAVGYYFYEKQSAGLGTYFLDSLMSDIDSLHLYAGIHPVVYDNYRCFSRRFPYAIYYKIEGDIIRVRAIYDTRGRPSRIKRRLKE